VKGTITAPAIRVDMQLDSDMRANAPRPATPRRDERNVWQSGATARRPSGSSELALICSQSSRHRLPRSRISPVIFKAAIVDAELKRDTALAKTPGIGARDAWLAAPFIIAQTIQNIGGPAR